MAQTSEAKSRVTESHVYPKDGNKARIRWVHDDEKPVELLFRGRYTALSPEEAYLIGSALMLHAEACGYDYETA